MVQIPKQPQPVGIFTGDAALPTSIKSLGNDEAALKRHAARMRQEHATADSSGPCQLCHWLPTKWDVELRWGATYYTREDIAKSAVGLLAVLLVRHGTTSSHNISFNTHHALCGACYRRLIAAWLGSFAAEKLCLATLCVGAIGAAATLVYVILEVTSRLTTQDEFILAVSLATSFAGLTVGLWLPRLVRRWFLPKALRPIGLWPYVLKRWQRLSIA